MRIYNVAQLMCAFRQYNTNYFNGVLPMPRIEIIHSFKYFGYFYSDICNNTTVNPVIQISDNWEYEEYQLKDIMVHEMIHYYLAYVGKDITGSHGYEFYRMSNDFNMKYGLYITERINMDEYKRRKGTSTFMYILTKLFCLW